MFPLQTDSLPTSASELRASLENSLRQVLQPTGGDMVSVQDRAFPALEAIRITLDGATARNGLRPPPSAPAGTPEPAFSVENFELSGHPLRVQGAALDLSCRAQAVQLRQGRDQEGKVVLLMQDAREGELNAAVPLADLESLVRRAATAAAKKQGAILEDLQLQINSRTERALDVKVRVRARKLFLTAAVHVAGSLEIDEQLQARLTGLTCGGEGTLGTMACGFLAPKLEQFEGREYSLLALPIGELKLRDIRLAVGKELRVTAQFGSAAA